MESRRTRAAEQSRAADRCRSLGDRRRDPGTVSNRAAAGADRRRTSEIRSQQSAISNQQSEI